MRTCKTYILKNLSVLNFFFKLCLKQVPVISAYQNAEKFTNCVSNFFSDMIMNVASMSVMTRSSVEVIDQI